MTTNQKFEKLIDNIETKGDALSFLKDLSIEEKKALVPTVTKLEKQLCTYEAREVNGFKSWSYLGTPKQFQALCLAGFFTMTQKEFTKSIGSFQSEIFYTLELHKIYSPDWFSSFVNNSRSHYLDYPSLIRLYKAGFLNPSKELIVPHLVNTIYELNGRDRVYRLDNLYLHPITIKEHIWLLFSEESTINWNGKTAKARGTNDWISAWVTLAERGEIDRIKALKECLNCASRNFDKVLTGWFFDLLSHLKPTKEELILLQKDLFLEFNTPNTKPISLCLKYIKTICTEKEFLKKEFLEVVPVLLSSDSKGIVNSTLMVLEKMAKKYPDLQNAIAALVPNAFLLKDEKLQTRAAKIITEYGDENSEDLCEEIACYHSELFSSVKAVLAKFKTDSLEEDEYPLEEFELLSIEKIGEDNAIESYETFEELVFFFSQVFDNNEDYHFDLFLELLPKLNCLVTEQNLAYLAPSFQRASKAIRANHKKSGFLEHYLANVYCNVIDALLKRFPGQKGLNKIREQIAEANEYQWPYLKKIPREKTLLPLIETPRKEDRNFPLSGASNYIPFQRRLTFARRLCEKNKTLPFLGTPTHAPCWLKMDVFIEKLAIYQTQNEAVNLPDFQIALNRLVFEKHQDYTSLISSSLTGEFEKILLYLIGESKLDFAHCENPSLWLAAIYRKGNQEELKQFIEAYDKFDRSIPLFSESEWKLEEETFETYDKKVKKRVFLRFNEEKEPKKISADLLPKLVEKNEVLDLIHHYFIKAPGFIQSIRPQDDKKMIYLSPHNPDLFCKLNIIENLSYSGYSTADNDRSANYVMEAFLEIWDDFGELSYLQLARTLFYIKKSGRHLAAEVWIQGVAQGEMNNELLGKCLGKLESLEFLPLKRLIDLINEFMINISKEHNEALETVLTNMLLEMGNNPIKGHTKLVSIYKEVIQLNDNKIHESVKSKIEAWKK